jgi:hypothetical protein
MNRLISHRSAALAVLAALLTSLGACSSDDDSAAAPSTDPTEATSPTEDCPEITGRHVGLAPGCWAFGRPGIPFARITLPPGLTGNPEELWLNDPGERAWGHLGITATGDVFPDPCTRTAAPPSNSSTIDDFAEALAAQKVTTTTEPVPVSLGGHDGLRLTVSVPAGFDPSRCTDEGLGLWQREDDDLGLDPGTVLRLWVVDVDGQHVVLKVTTEDVATEETVKLFTGIVGSAIFAES